MKIQKEVEETARSAFNQIMAINGYVEDPLSPRRYIGDGFFNELYFRCTLCLEHYPVGLEGTARCYRIFIASYPPWYSSSHIHDWIELEAYFANFAKLMEMLSV